MIVNILYPKEYNTDIFYSKCILVKKFWLIYRYSYAKKLLLFTINKKEFTINFWYYVFWLNLITYEILKNKTKLVFVILKSASIKCLGLKILKSSFFINFFRRSNM